jgi:signal transduction histidine kinase/DNA-binding response OmpR family regulator
MRISQIPGIINQKLEDISIVGNGDLSVTSFKKYHFVGIAASTFLVATLLLIAWLMSIYIIVSYCLSLILLYSFGLSAIVLFKKTDYLLFFQKIGTLLITVFFVSQSGGLLNSGGIILIGLAPIIYSLIFEKIKWMILINALFVISVVLLFIFDSQLPGKELITAKQNLILFMINLPVISSCIFVFALYTLKLNTNLEKKEVLRQKEIHEAKTRLFTNITHEFRTPLTVIMGVADSFKNKSTPDIHAKADTIIRNGKSLLQLVDQMLDLSKIESGNIKVNMTYGNIIPLLQYIFQLQEYYAQEKNLEFNFIAESQSYELDFDPEKITTVVSNLLNNAIKFTPPGGVISMGVKVMNENLCIEIKDNGVGIENDKLEKVFDRFYQIDDKDTRKSGGVGIGLAITKELINLMNGSMELHSTPGKETLFIVRLPFANSQKNKAIERDQDCGKIFEQKPLNTAFEDQVMGSKDDIQRLLIIEDNKDVISYLEACYSNQFMVDIAFNGQQGYDKAIKLIPDLIISDIMMPEMNGFTLCKKLKDDYRTSHIPIILLTAKADVPSRIQGLEQGADAFITKPFNQEELLARINNLLELRKKLYRRYSNEGVYENPGDSKFLREDQFIKCVRDTIVRNLHNEAYNVHFLCDEMAMSKSQFYRKFKALTNMSAAKYIRKLRMERAKHLLLTTSMNISEISYEVGIKTPSTFSELFKDEYGYCPRDFVNYNLEKSK